jgi:hypothetical protein
MESLEPYTSTINVAVHISVAVNVLFNVAPAFGVLSDKQYPACAELSIRPLLVY